MYDHGNKVAENKHLPRAYRAALKNSTIHQQKTSRLLSDLVTADKRYQKYKLTESSSSTFIRTGHTVHPAVQMWFQAMDTKNEGRITSTELQQAFEIFQGKHFSDSSCKFVVRLFDLDKHGGLDIKEFESLYYHIKQWMHAFNAYDRERSGFLDETELAYALKHMDINFSSDFIRYLVIRSNPKARKISLDQYIVTCIQLQKFTDEFKSRDKNYSGRIQIDYEEFLEMVLRCL